MQGLSSGNYSFQAFVIDAAGNVGNASRNYMFTVDKNLALDGATRAAFWGLGWKFWLIIGCGAFTVLLAISLIGGFLAMRVCKRGVAADAGPYTPHRNTVVRNQQSSLGLSSLWACELSMMDFFVTDGLCYVKTRDDNPTCLRHATFVGSLGSLTAAISYYYDALRLTCSRLPSVCCDKVSATETLSTIKTIYHMLHQHCPLLFAFCDLWSTISKIFTE